MKSQIAVVVVLFALTIFCETSRDHVIAETAAAKAGTFPNREAAAQPSDGATSQLAVTPPLGWNSWDGYGTTINEDQVHANAQWFAERLKPFGWEYVVVDMEWFVTNPIPEGNSKSSEFSMDANGRYTPAPKRFPSSAAGAGFKPLGDYIHSLGLKTAQGTYVTTGFYWDDNEATRAFAKRFFEKRQRMPTKEQANTYAAVLHYLKAIDAAKTDDAEKVTAQMKAMPTDYFGRAGSIRQDGRVLYDLALYQVKKPEESKYPWDYYKKVRDITAAEAFRPLAAGGCPFVK